MYLFRWSNGCIRQSDDIMHSAKGKLDATALDISATCTKIM